MAYVLADYVKRRRDLKAQFEAETKAVSDKFTPKIAALDAYLLKYLIDNKQKTVATEFGTVLTYKRRAPKVTDFNAFDTWCEFNDKNEFIKQVLDSTELLAYLDRDAKNLLPDGLAMDSTDVLSIKAPK